MNQRNVLIDGVPLDTISVTDRGFHYGDAVFTTLRSFKGGLRPFLEAHFDRLERDARRLAIEMPERSLLKEEIERLLGDQEAALIKIQLSRGSAGRGYRIPENAKTLRVISRHPLPDYPKNYWDEGVNLWRCQIPLGVQPILSGIKHHNRLEQVLGRSEWTDSLYQEGLMQDGLGRLTEGTMSNCMLIRAGKVFTPRLDQTGVAGVMRHQIMGALTSLRIPVEEARLTFEDLGDADECFITNSVIGVWPVIRAGDHIFQSPGPITQEIQRWLTRSTGVAWNVFDTTASAG